MKTMTQLSLYTAMLLISGTVFSQQKITGMVTDNSNININPVLIVNISKGTNTLSDTSGKFTIDASENDEIRFVKDGYYRSTKKISKDDFNAPLLIILKRDEIEIQEVKVAFKPTGNLEKDSKRFNESKKLKTLKSDMDEYLKRPLNEPIPKNTISKTFSGHDFSAGQADVLKVIGAAIGLFNKATKPKITKATYGEYQIFMTRLKNEVDVSFLKKYGMDEEQIDEFLYYAEDAQELSKKYRKDFRKTALETELKKVFTEYSKTHRLTPNKN